MLVVHWSPVKNTKAILKHGLRKDSRGVFCFPLSGSFHLDRWWARAFRTWSSPQPQYNGFVFRLEDADFPAQFAPWGNAREKPLATVAALTAAYRETLIWRIGEAAHHGWIPCDGITCACEHLELDCRDTYQALGDEIARRFPRHYNGCLMRNPGFLQYVFEDYEIVLSRSIAPKRIINVLTNSQRSGRTRYREHKYRDQRRFADD